jgi:hypothetical protein
MRRVSKVAWSGIAMVIAGMVSGILEKIFYDRLDENNVLQESFFLPLAVILIILGTALIGVAAVRYIARKSSGKT